MSGGTHVYDCTHCPIVIELGGYTAWNDDGTIDMRTIQLVCTTCGTMHRLTEREGDCRLTALRGPVREIRTVTVRDVSGEEFETMEWVAETDWRPAGQHPGGIAAVEQAICSHCGQDGQMLSLEKLLYPEGYTVGATRREDCPMCGALLRCIAVTDAI